MVFTWCLGFHPGVTVHSGERGTCQSVTIKQVWVGTLLDGNGCRSDQGTVHILGTVVWAWDHSVWVGVTVWREITCNSDIKVALSSWLEGSLVKH